MQEKYLTFFKIFFTLRHEHVQIFSRAFFGRYIRTNVVCLLSFVFFVVLQSSWFFTLLYTCARIYIYYNNNLYYIITLVIEPWWGKKDKRQKTKDAFSVMNYELWVWILSPWGDKRGVFLIRGVRVTPGNKKECFCILTHPTVGTRRALSEEFKARMSLKTQVPRLSVLINNNRGISDVREFRAKK